MKYLVKMTDKEYNDFRRYTSEKKGFEKDTRRDFTSDFRYQSAEDWLLETGKIVLIDRDPDTRGRIYRDAYLVIKGSEVYIQEVLEILYEEYLYDTTYEKRTILRNRDRRIIREV